MTSYRQNQASDFACSQISQVILNSLPQRAEIIKTMRRRPRSEGLRAICDRTVKRAGQRLTNILLD